MAGDVSLVDVGKRGAAPRLEQVRGPGAPREFVLDLDETIVGRGNQSTVCVESSLLSRRHLSIRRQGPEFRCQDLDSQNGVFVNGVKAHAAVLHEGDTLQIGDVVFVFHEGR